MAQVQCNNDSKLVYGLLPTLPVILGMMVVIWQNGATLYNVLSSILLVLCGMGTGLFLWSRHVNELAQINSSWLQDENRKIGAVATYTAELERLLLTVSPILSQQVMVSREHTEQEIISLANRFANMINGLQQIVDSTDNTLGEQRNYHFDNVINNSRDLLKPVLGSLIRFQKVEHDVNAELSKLSGYMNGLSSVAAEVRGLAEQINLLALSAANEASLAAGGQQSSTLVADSAHKLADDASQIAKQLILKVDDVAAAVDAALNTSKKSLQVDDLTLHQAELNINQTLSLLSLTLTHYRDDVEVLRNNAEQIRDEINNVLVALQFQDRVSQILTQVENNLLNLQKTIERIQQQGSNRDSNMLRVDEAVEHIEENYKTVSSPPNYSSNKSDDLTFF